MSDAYDKANGEKSWGARHPFTILFLIIAGSVSGCIYVFDKPNNPGANYQKCLQDLKNVGNWTTREDCRRIRNVEENR